MNSRPEITAMLSLSIQRHICPDNDPRIYWAREVTFDYATTNAVRVDFMKFKPVNNTVSGIEKGDFYCYEVKSSVEDFHSKNGHNFLGDYNYYVMPEEVYEHPQTLFAAGFIGQSNLLRGEVTAVHPENRFTLRVEQMDLQAEVEDAIYTYRELFRQDGIDLEYLNAGEMFERPITGDPERLKQVLCNVLDNAAKHGGSGKRIVVRLTQENEAYVITIRDFGPGIPVAELPYVKQKFYKGSSKARGSGIGLAVCDEIITRHGGTFEIGNADGGGALVTITLPIPPHTEHR